MLESNIDQPEKMFADQQLVKIKDFATIQKYNESKPGTKEEKEQFASFLADKYVRVIGENKTTLLIETQSGERYFLDASLVNKEKKEA